MKNPSNKRIRKGVLTAALAGGTVIGATQLGGIVDAAQADDTTTEEGGTTADDVTPEDRQERREARREARQQNHQEVADLIGVDVDDLRDWLRGGGTLADVATENGVDPAAVVTLLVEQANERIDGAVENGRLDAAEADEKRAEVAERVTTAVNEGRQERPRRAARREARQENHQEVADLIGVDVDDLRGQLRSGETLADVATENGVDPAAVVTLLVEQANERIDGAVENGRLDAAEADEKRAEVAERVTTRVNEGRPERADGGPRGPRGGDGAPAVDDAEG